MDVVLFNGSFADIEDLNRSEGPHYNIYEPKFEARRQMHHLLETVSNVYVRERSWQAVRQVCRCLAFLARTMLEVEEEEGVVEAGKAYTLLKLCVAEDDAALPEDPRVVSATPLTDIVTSENLCLQRKTGFAACVEYLQVHNTVAMYLSRGVHDAAKAEPSAVVLKRAQTAYDEWNEWFVTQTDSPQLANLPITDKGRLDMEKLQGDDDAARGAALLRFEMDSAYTGVLFSLAQICTLHGDATAAAHYCHLTMYYQLLCKPEFDRKDWARNALQLSEYHGKVGEFGRAWHCLRAGELMMPAKNPDDTTRGAVAWSTGRFHLSRLLHYGTLRNAVRPANPVPEEIPADWVNFPIPGLDPATPMAPILTFEDAREAFKDGNTALQEALEYHPFQSSCTAYVDITYEITRLYGALELFEDNRNRRIAMLQRRVTLLEDFPDKLSFNAYPTMVRQVLYDLGFLSEDILRLRQEQRQGPLQSGEKPLKDGAFNALVASAKSFYERFVETWRSPLTHQIPSQLDTESRKPFYRALMRLAHLELCPAFATLKEQYDALGRTQDAYQRAIDFAKDNQPLGTEEDTEPLAKEIGFAKQMVELLPLKRNNLWTTYQRSLHK